jgi:pimeloyl-ACP methyl ester carboxylesterase
MQVRPAGIRVADGGFSSPISTGYPENDHVFLRHWSGESSGLSVIGLGGLVQLGYYWFDALACSLARKGIEFWMMDEPFNHCRTPCGYVPGELIAGGGPRQLIAAVRQAVIDARCLITRLRSQGQRVGVVGQSYGGWLSLLLSLLEPDLEFVISLIPMCDLPAWYSSGLPLARAARQNFPAMNRTQLRTLLQPINPIAWHPRVKRDRIEIHVATQDRLVLHQSIRELVNRWDAQMRIHHRGHYSVFFGKRLRDQVIQSIDEMATPTPRHGAWSIPR